MKNSELNELHRTLGDWAKDAVTRLGAAHVYVFGSLVYKNGEQFGDSSDIDLVVVMPELADAPARTRWLESFSEHKQQLEGKLVQALQRSAEEPIVSVVAVTEVEIAMDVHKDGHLEFFSQNHFRDLMTGEECTGLPHNGIQKPSRFTAAAVAFTQKVRNEHFATSFNTRAKLVAFGGGDPLPKRFMRAAAMAARARDDTLEPGVEHDVRAGLDLLFVELTMLRNQKNPAYLQLQDLVSVRRGARGAGGPIKPSDQLLLAELIYDLALTPQMSSTEPARRTDLKVPPLPQPVEPNALEMLTVDDAEIGSVVVPEAQDSEPIDITTATTPSLNGGQLTIPHGSSTAFFNDRFCAAFPGDRRITWYENDAEIAMRLNALLQPPLMFADGIPIWWWRGGNLQIETFERLEDGTYLMNVEELAIRRIASAPGRSYKRSFVYVETDAMEPTRLYEYTSDDLAASIETFGYSTEEYGLFMGRHRLTREEYDDGGAKIDGNLVDTRGKTRLRVRYTSPYNFLIAPIGSPINNSAFDRDLETILNGALKMDRETAIERLWDIVQQLPLREGRAL